MEPWATLFKAGREEERVPAVRLVFYLSGNFKTNLVETEGHKYVVNCVQSLYQVNKQSSLQSSAKEIQLHPKLCSDKLFKNLN